MKTRPVRAWLAALALLASTALPLSGQARLPRVTVIGTGGTIAGQSATRTSFQDYRAGQLSISDMVDELRPQIDQVAQVTTVQFGNRGSGGYGIGDYHDLTLAVEQALETADAVVVTTGTTTMEEFVYWSDLTVQSQKPVVYTGAMRPWTVIGTDAHANLFNAIVLAASGETHCMGSVLMLNDEFFAAKEVWKSDGSRMDTFVARQSGSLGYVDGLGVRTFRAPPRYALCDDPERWRTPFDLRGVPKDDLPRVEVLMGYQGVRQDEGVRALADAGVRGIVLAQGGAGAEARAYAEERGVVFVNTERFRSGGDNLMPPKARLLLLLSLATTSGRDAALERYRATGALEWGEQLPPRTADASTSTAATARPKVTVIGTGGTIAGSSTTPTSFQNYRAGQLAIADMVDELRPYIDEVADVTTVQFGNRGSGSYDIVDYMDLTIAIEAALETADAVVVTTGTGTQDEFVYWSELTVRSPKPVVFTGAMRPWTVLGTDAHANLFNAIVLAASGETRCFGSVNILNDEFHAAKEVWKSDASRMDTFADRQTGVLGYVDGLDVRTFRAPPRVQFCDDPERWRWPFDLTGMDRASMPRVEVVMGVQGGNLDELIRALADAGVAGIVTAGGGASAEARAYAEGKGVVFASTQRFRSGGDNLMPQKARLLLMVSLATASSKEEALAAFERVAGLEFGARRPVQATGANGG